MSILPLRFQRTCPKCGSVIILVNSETPPHLQFDWCLCKDRATALAKQARLTEVEEA